jgi:Saxitoxin biosynthesis operon protein SxtJ
MASRTGQRELRRFGFIVGGIFGVIGLWPWVVRGQAPRPWVLGLAVALILPALVAPRVLAPVQRVWTAAGEALGWVNTRIVLGVIFFGVVTPTGLVLRLAGRDPMRRGFDGEAATYRIARKTRPGAHMTRQF